MDQFHYRLVQPNEDHTAAVIEKSGITAQFTLAEVQAMQARNKAAKREVEGQITLEKAKMNNIERHHPKVKELSSELLVAAAIYKDSMSTIAHSEPKLKQIDEAIAENDAMVAQVMKDLKLKPHVKKTVKAKKG